MKRLRIFVVVLTAFFAVACSSAMFKENADTSAFVYEKTNEQKNQHDMVSQDSKNVDSEKKNSDVSETVNKNDSENTSENSESKDTASSGKVNNKQGIILDFEVLDKLDNTKRGWGVKLNNEHKTPGINSETKKLFEKYGAIYTGNTEDKVIYLTFDEGYENGYTPKILDTLKENEIKSIFFITGSYLKKNPELVKRMLEEGHIVGNHTVKHPSLPMVDNIRLEQELLGLENEFNNMFGTSFKYMRPPMGEFSERTLAAAKQMGYKTVFWSFTYKDYDVNDQKGADYAYKKVMDNIHNGAVLLLHAVSKDNAEALDRIIKDLKEQGYKIMPFDL